MCGRRILTCWGSLRDSTDPRRRSPRNGTSTRTRSSATVTPVESSSGPPATRSGHHRRHPAPPGPRARRLLGSLRGEAWRGRRRSDRRRPIGVPATSSIEEILPWRRTPSSTAPLIPERDEVARDPRSGKNVVTPVGWFYPTEKDGAPLAAACAEEGPRCTAPASTRVGSPSLHPDVLRPLLCVTFVRGQEFSDIRTYDAPDVVRHIMMFGGAPDDALGGPMLGLLTGSCIQSVPAGLYHNTAVVLESDGSIAGKYRKMHIPDDPGLQREVLLHARRPRLPPDRHQRRPARRAGVLGPVVSGSGAPDGAGRRRPAAVSDRDRLGPGRRGRREGRASARPGCSAIAATRSPTACRCSAAIASATRLRRSAAAASISGAAATCSARRASSSPRPRAMQPELLVADVDLRAQRKRAPHLAVPARPPHRRLRRPAEAFPRLMALTECDRCVRDGQPRAVVARDGVRYTLLGTAHVSRASVDAVEAAVAGGALRRDRGRTRSRNAIAR